MNPKLSGLSRSRVAILCSAECDAGLVLVLGIMRGLPPRSSVGRRVLKWCRDNGYPIGPTNGPKGRSPARTLADASEDILAQAECIEAERAARRGG